MKIPFLNKQVGSPKKTATIATSFNDISEKLKGEIQISEDRFSKELGEPHPFDFSKTEQLVKKYGMLNAIIDKYIDFVIGPGIFFTGEDERAVELIENMARETNLNFLLRKYLREAFIKGNAFMEIDLSNGIELQIINANNMYVQRSKKGEIQFYKQFIRTLHKKIDNAKEFKPEEIMHFAYNVFGDDAYGTGMIEPVTRRVDQILGHEKDLLTLMERKAGSPLHIQIGTPEEPGSPEEVQAVGQDLEWLNNKHEWATDERINIKTIDFGNIGEKFSFVLEHFMRNLTAETQIPEVIMGYGNIPEGLAKVQEEVFERRISSIQEDLEKYLETRLFKPYLISQGINVHVEVNWGQPNSREKNEKLTRLQSLLQLPLLNMKLREQIELQVADLLSINREDVETSEEEKQRELEQKQPIVPGQNNQNPTEHFRITEDFIEDSNKMKLSEWLQFNYLRYLEAINEFIDKDDFSSLMARTEAEASLGKLSEKKINKLKSTLKKSFDKNENLLQISERIRKEVRPGDRYTLRGNKKIKQMSEDFRSQVIARTETTRVAANGSLDHFGNGGINEVRWVSTIGERTCPICENGNGTILNIEDAKNIIPAHVGCRCTWVPQVSDG